ncbi:ATP-binding protein [Aquibacillus albus]|uniref:ATP-dependent endonuclease of OLD family n=1 Tax=Aquibacillus albus TaxID=1168171 RepID=A0ABS2N487_9BACI|nr:ATP-binding protein [Aquibacillus albus]MBM7572938.1 putative ATP-dependent endonuclease of OLD family [Aquibacillus albus]
MKLKKVILENFRSYKDRVSIEFDDLTAFIGKNDIGKSTILEALEIYFNNSLVKIEQADLCVHSDSPLVRIGCVFTDLPNEIVIDSTAKTTLQEEFLLNKDDQLEIHKVYDCSKKTLTPNVFIVANHPENESCSDLLQLTRPQLTKKLKDLGIDEGQVDDMRSNVSIRQGIYNNMDNLELRIKEVPLAKGDAKSVWDKLKMEIPIYSLFQSDRPSLDGDSEVQDPMKLAIKESLESVQKELDSIKKSVEESAMKVAAGTLEKLKEMDESLANQLTPQFIEEPKWDKIFKLSLDGDDSIPINKRGSGVRRLILLNFFRAEAERKQTENNTRGIIYAIEEPETAQHPSNQILLANAFKALSETGSSQVIMTTHVPGFAGLLPVESLRFIKEYMDVKQIINAKINKDIVQEVAETLGVLPSINDTVKVLVFVEGIHDVSTIKTFSRIVSENNNGIINFCEDDRVAIIPSGGSTLKGWVEQQYLKTLGLPEVHIYDSDNMNPPKYQKYCDIVNAKEDGSKAFSTVKRELENYISPQAIKEVLGIDISITSECDVPNLIARMIHAHNSPKPWEDVKDEKKKEKEGKVKRKLNNQVVQAMTYDQLCSIDTEKEVESWLLVISDLCNVSVPN